MAIKSAVKHKWWALICPLVLGAGGCDQTPTQERVVEPQRPGANRELWDFRLEVHEPNLRVRIGGRYGQDFLDEEITVVDSGVAVSFESAEGVVRSRLVAQRLRLEHQGGQVSLIGEVVARAGDSLTVETDSLVWQRQGETLWLPGRVQLNLAQGVETGRGLRAEVDLSEWEMEEVEGVWRGEGYTINLRARREHGWRRGKGIQADYENVKARWQGGQVEAGWAVFDAQQELVVFTGGVTSADSNRVLRAGQVEVELKAKRVLAQEGVVMEVDSLTLLAAELAEEEGGKWQAKGQPAILDHQGRRISARRLWGVAGAGAVEAAGEVVGLIDRLQLEAQQLSYDRDKNQLEAGGQVVLHLEDFAGQARGGRLRYRLDEDWAALEESPQVERQRPGEEALLLEAEGMAFNLKENKLVGQEQFVLSGPKVAIEARRGEYDYGEEVLYLGRQVVLRHGVPERRRLEADSMVVRLEAGQVQRVELPIGVEGAINEEQAVAWIQAKTGQVHWSGETLERVELNGEAEVVQEKLADGGVSRFSGEAVVIYFDGAGQLVRMTAAGGAQLHSRIGEAKEGEPSLNQVSGERLEILLAEGAIDTVRVLEGIEGKYFPSDSELKQP